MMFMEAVKGVCSNKPTIYTDRAGLYEWPIRLLGMGRRKKTFGRRNIVELWFSKLKRRIRQFNVCFLTNKPETAEKGVKAWIALT